MGSTCEKCGMPARTAAVLLILCCLAASLGNAADWPMYRADAARSGVTGEKLSFPLANAWVYSPPQPPRPAWADSGAEWRRIELDRCPQPIMANGLVLFGSSADDTVRALDAVTGQIRWRFTTGGPVRFAPSVAGDKAYVTSDDGFLYCLDAATGKVLWRFRGGINDEQILGEGRMISRWPLRSGALVMDGVVYTAAGMWPTEGVFIYALDAATGKELWCNDTSGIQWNYLPHWTYGYSGVAPQGYLLAAQDILLVPTGRSVPAGFDRRTGRFLFYRPGESQHAGGTWATIAGNRYYNPGAFSRDIAAYDLESGKASGAGIKADIALPSAKGLVRAHEGRIYGYPKEKTAWNAVHGETYVMALAADALVLGGKGSVTALDMATGGELWKASVPGAVRGIAVAGGRLIVSTDAGAVHCFAPGGNGKPKTITDPQIIDQISRTPAGLDAIVARCREARITRGYALVVGEPDSAMASALAAKTELHCLTALPGAARAVAERDTLLGTTAFLGSRVAVQELTDAERLPYPPYLANLIVVGADRKAVSAKELYRVLHPCGGVMCFPGTTPAEARAFLKEAGIPPDEIGEAQGMLVVTRGKLEGAFDWDSKVASDQRLRWPLELAWFGGPGPARSPGSRTPLAAAGRLFLAGRDHLMALDAYNGCELWARQIAWSADGLGGIPAFRDTAADAEDVYLHLQGVSVRFDARTGQVKNYYGLKYSTEYFSLSQPRTFALDIDAEHSASVTVQKTDAGLELILAARDPKVVYPIRQQGANYGQTRTVWVGDYWELFLDFRPPAERFGLYGPGAVQTMVIPATAGRPASVRPGAGPAHPKFSVAGEATQDGTSTTLRLSWAEMESLVGRRPESFGFAFKLNAYDADKPSDVLGQFDKDKAVSHRRFADRFSDSLNNGWATLTFGAEGPRPAAPESFGQLVRTIEELPKELTEGRRPPMSFQKFWSPKPSGTRLNPLTGEKEPLAYFRTHGCGGAAFADSMAFFRSAATGIYDLREDSGLRMFGGVRSSCGVSTLPALGLLLAPDGGCPCSYNYRCSVALVPAPQRRNEDWALFPGPKDGPTTPAIVHACLNLGAAGDRRVDEQTLWLGFPRPVGGFKSLYPKPGQPATIPYAFQVPLTVVARPGMGAYRFNSDRVKIANSDKPWVYASGYRGIERAELVVSPERSLVSLPAALAPAIDGTLDDACWDGKEPVPFAGQETIMLRHDAEALYTAFRRPARFHRSGEQYPWLKKTQGEDAPVWDDDSCELFISDDTRNAVVHLGVSASGARYDASCVYTKDKTEDKAWNGTWQSAAVADNKALVVEMAVPWKTLADAGLDREKLTVNIRTRDGQLRSPGANGWARCEFLSPLGLAKPRPLSTRPFTVRLHFAEPDDVGPGGRVFDVRLQGRVVLSDFDVARDAGGPRRALVKEFHAVQAADVLVLDFVPKAKDIIETTAPILSGLEVAAE